MTNNPNNYGNPLWNLIKAMFCAWVVWFAFGGLNLDGHFRWTNILFVGAMLVFGYLAYKNFAKIGLHFTGGKSLDEAIKGKKNEKEYFTCPEPPLDLLNKSESKTEDMDTSLILKTLDLYFEMNKIPLKFHEVIHGTSVTRILYKPYIHNKYVFKVKKILNDRQTIAMFLGLKHINIEYPHDNKPLISFDIPASSRGLVTLGDVLTTPEYKKNMTPTTFAIGKDVSGGPIFANIEDMPHLLVGGATGTGKSVFINSLVTSLLYGMKTKLVLLDAKQVELTHYNGIQNLLFDTITSVDEAVVMLERMTLEMDRRYNLFKGVGAKDIISYNRKVDKSSQLYRIVIVIDELADLMLVSKKRVEESIVRLAQLSRASGIHLVVATQRPTVDVVTGLIKANIPSRIAFTTASAMDSRVIMDMTGAEKLSGKGEMLYKPNGTMQPIRVQGCYVSDDEIDNVVSFIKDKTKWYTKKEKEESEAKKQSFEDWLNSDYWNKTSYEDVKDFYDGTKEDFERETSNSNTYSKTQQNTSPSEVDKLLNMINQQKGKSA